MPAFRPPSICFALAIVFVWAAGSLSAADLQGHVTDPDGRPTPRARVLLANPVEVIAITETDGQGRFRFDRLAAGAYEVRVALDGFNATPIRLRLAAGESQTVDVPLRLSAISESVVVSAARVDLPLSRVPGSVTVITADDLRTHQTETVADALRLVPGLTVTTSGTAGGLTSVFPRGGESNFTLVLVDGIRLNAFGGGFDFAHLQVGDIERIEIVRGPQSAQYGSDAIGGVVQIITRGGGPPRLEGLVEGGSFGGTRAWASWSGAARQRGSWEWGATAERVAGDGLDGFVSRAGEEVANDSYRTTSGAMNLGWRSRGTHIRGDVKLASNDRGFPGPFGSDPGGTYSGIDRVSRGVNETAAYAVSLTHALSSRVRQRVEVGYTALDGTFTSPFGTSMSRTHRLDGRLQTDFSPTPSVGLSTGLEFVRERAGSTFITGAQGELIPVRRLVVGYFGEARLALRDRLLLTAGLRVEHIRRDRLAPDPNAFSPRPAFDPDAIVSGNPRLSVTYALKPPSAGARSWTRLHASAGTGIRPPDALEIAFTDNPSLEPERSRSLDLGIEQALLGDALVVDLTAFLNRYDDLIVAVGRSLVNASQFRTDNIANARSRGLELEARGRTSWGLEAGAGYTWLSTEVLAVDGTSDQAPPPFAVGDLLIRRPRHQGHLELAWTRGMWATFGRVRARGAQLDIDPSFGALGGLFNAPGFAVVDLGGTIRLRDHLELFGRVTNLFDRAYEEALGFPAFGRGVVAGARVATSR